MKVHKDYIMHVTIVRLSYQDRVVLAGDGNAKKVMINIYEKKRGGGYVRRKKRSRYI